MKASFAHTSIRKHRYSVIWIALVFLLSALWIAACGVPKTTSCPNCMNAKPVYYNKEKARDARRAVRHAGSHSAIGGQTLPEPIGNDHRKARPKKNKGAGGNILENEPIL